MSSSGTQLPCPGLRQCWSTSKTPSESKMIGSPLSEKNTLLRVPPGGSATVSADWRVSSRFMFRMEYVRVVWPWAARGPFERTIT